MTDRNKLIAKMYLLDFVGKRLSFDVFNKNSGEILIWAGRKINLSMLVRIVEQFKDVECGDSESDIARQINKFRSPVLEGDKRKKSKEA